MPPSERLKIYRDPVCGMNLEDWGTQYEIVHEGIEYHFCSSECKQAFQLFPDRFIQKAVPVD
jgi:YHS domain-containing protein